MKEVEKMIIYKLEFRNKLKSLLTWIIVLSIFIFAMAAFLPSMETENMKSLVDTKLEGMPESVLAAFGIKQIPDFSNPSVFYGYVMQYINLAIGIFIGILSGNTLVEEESNGTIEYIYAQPISRKKIFIEKLLATMTILLILVIFINIIGFIALGIFKSDNYLLKDIGENIFKITLGSIFTNFIFLSIGILVSSILKNTNSVSGISMAVVFGTFIIGIIGDLVEKYEILNYLSPLNIMSPMEIIEKMPAMKIIIPWIVVGLLFIAMSYINYQKKDFNI